MHFFFFFQAEDGIRDIGVTGVQTCALPILASAPSVTVRTRPVNSPRDSISAVRSRSAGLSSTSRISVVLFMALPFPGNRVVLPGESEFESRTKIGRASCRARGDDKVAEGLS